MISGWIAIMISASTPASVIAENDPLPISPGLGRGVIHSSPVRPGWVTPFPRWNRPNRYDCGQYSLPLYNDGGTYYQTGWLPSVYAPPSLNRPNIPVPEPWEKKKDPSPLNPIEIPYQTGLETLELLIDMLSKEKLFSTGETAEFCRRAEVLRARLVALAAGGIKDPQRRKSILLLFKKEFNSVLFSSGNATKTTGATLLCGKKATATSFLLTPMNEGNLKGSEQCFKDLKRLILLRKNEDSKSAEYQALLKRYFKITVTP